MLAEKITKALNAQLAHEERNSRIYLQMAGYCDAGKYRGIAKWMYAASEDETKHKMIIASYLADRNCLFVISAQEAPVVNYSSPDLLFQDVMKIEVGTSKALTDIYLMCLKEGDAITAAWIEGLLKEQIEEEDKVQTILDFIQLTGTTPPGLALLDEKVASLA